MCSPVGVGPQVRSRAFHTARARLGPSQLKGEPQQVDKQVLVPAEKRGAANGHRLRFGVMSALDQTV